MSAAQMARTVQLPAGRPEVDELGLLAEVVGVAAAANLVEEFGRLREIALADDGELRAAGLSRKAIVRLRASMNLGLRLCAARERGPRLCDAREVARHFSARLSVAEAEEFWIVAVDVRHRIVGEVMIARGTLAGVEVHPREVFKWLIRAGAAACILCHNHPSGDPSPSRQDLELTARLREVGELCGIAVLDHLIVSAGGLFMSLAERGWL
jgi:DNA repair protein RadC